ncbi:toll/interleukin-1 receptor domain-containing protein [Fulvivirga sp. 29W222]|uniref:Toll/interleukin-1 receptor domain-containing protein n=1 Tax=Fulvivirga marina TaxID=2494733 RepID=A0A937KD41_9BACT|nr:toll/interleukin-1 receptor domain-containing protein [Fulvivirga marina]MBL6448202.1 toll/interleukin-1 receptor domain-containing protein [Fulvivirga marina]
MSIKTNQDNIARIGKDIAGLEKKLADESKKELDKTKQINLIDKSITKNTSLSSLKSKQSQMIRIQGDLAKIAKTKADLTKKIADKKSQELKYQQQLDRDLRSERTKTEQADKRRRQEELNHHRQITYELQKQKSLSTDININKTITSQKKYDFFISHASEDKEGFVRLLADRLSDLGLSIWYDEFQLKIGDSLRRSIDEGLKNSKYGIVVLSTAFFNKNWTQYELDGLVTKEMNGVKVILPIWHKVSKDEVIQYSPTLADKVALNSSIMSISDIAKELRELVN